MNELKNKRILCEFAPCAPEYMRRVWANCFLHLGYDFKFWDTRTKPAFDVFDEYEPDLFIGTTFNFNEPLFKCVKERPELKVFMVTSNNGPLDDEIDLKEYPILVATYKEKKLLEKLKKETGQPEFICLHYHQNDVDKTMSRWRDIGLNPIALTNAADTFEYYMAKDEKIVDYDKLKSELSYVGGYWAFKSRNLDKYILPLCNPIGKYNIKIFGNQGWGGVPQFCNTINTERVKHLFASAIICPNVSEPHSNRWGFDPVERPFKITINANAFCISDYVETFKTNIFGDSLPMAKTPQDFFDMIDYFLKNPEKREPYMEKAHKICLTSHTGFSRVAKIFKNLNMPEEEKRTIDAFEKQFGFRCEVG